MIYMLDYSKKKSKNYLLPFSLLLTRIFTHMTDSDKDVRHHVRDKTKSANFKIKTLSINHIF